MALDLDRVRREPFLTPQTPEPAAPAREGFYSEPALIVGSAEAADLLGVGQALAPLVDLSLSPLAETPLVVGICGPEGAGKTFALRRLADAIAVAASQPPDPEAPRLNKVVIAPLDAAGLGSDRAVGFDPASALASAVFVALEKGVNGVSYAALADEAAHGSADPARASIAATERHDEISRRLDAERAERAEVEAKRARLTDLVLYETPGSRIDTMIRAERPTIETRLRRFGFGEGDVAANYRDLLRDLAALSPTSRAGLLLRSIWAYRGQGKLVFAVVAALIAAYGLKRLGAASADGSLVDQFGDNANVVASFVGAHALWIGRAIAALNAVAALAAFFNLWRAAGFAALLFRGSRLLVVDRAERKRDLDASAARVERRLATLTAEAEAAAKRADALAERAGGARNVARGPGPAFLKALETPAKTSRDFFIELARLMSKASSSETPVPNRIVVMIDNLAALPPADAKRLIDAARALLGKGALAFIACDVAAIAPAAPAAFARSRFDLAFNVACVGAEDSERLAAKLIGEGGRASAPLAAPAASPALAEPLAPAEIALIATLAPLTGGAPGAIKRLYNAYRLARATSEAPRPLIALMLAALLSPDEANARAVEAALADLGGGFHEPSEAGPALTAAFRAARGVKGSSFIRAEAEAAWKVARRWATV